MNSSRSPPSFPWCGAAGAAPRSCSTDARHSMLAPPPSSICERGVDAALTACSDRGPDVDVDSAVPDRVCIATGHAWGMLATDCSDQYATKCVRPESDWLLRVWLPPVSSECCAGSRMAHLCRLLAVGSSRRQDVPEVIELRMRSWLLSASSRRLCLQGPAGTSAWRRCCAVSDANWISNHLRGVMLVACWDVDAFHDHDDAAHRTSSVQC